MMVMMKTLLKSKKSSVSISEINRFKYQLIFYCAPTIKKLKLGSMFHIKIDEYDNLDAILERFNNYLKPENLYLCKFCHNSRFTIMIFHIPKLQHRLKELEIRTFLSKFGYPSCFKNIQTDLSILEKRLNCDNSFPHEIGIFLGYPLIDVLGFINNEKCLFCGYWKVYDSNNVQAEKYLFKKYDECCSEMLKESVLAY